MAAIHVDLKTCDESIRRICRAAFPGYAGRTARLRIWPDDRTYNVRSSWDGGSRDSFVFVRLSDNVASRAVPAQSAFDRPIAGAESVVLPAGLVLVTHTIFCGKDLGLKIDVRQSDSNPHMLPPALELSADESATLQIICGLKSFARDEERQRRGLTREAYDLAKTSLIGRGLLTKAGAATPAGRTERDRQSGNQY